jgi:hypothetical protein
MIKYKNITEVQVLRIVREFAPKYNGDWKPKSGQHNYYLVASKNQFSYSVDWNLSPFQVYFKDSGFVSALEDELREYALKEKESRKRKNGRKAKAVAE